MKEKILDLDIGYKEKVLPEVFRDDKGGIVSRGVTRYTPPYSSCTSTTTQITVEREIPVGNKARGLLSRPHLINL